MFANQLNTTTALSVTLLSRSNAFFVRSLLLIPQTTNYQNCNQHHSSNNSHGNATNSARRQIIIFWIWIFIFTGKRETIPVIDVLFSKNLLTIKRLIQTLIGSNDSSCYHGEDKRAGDRSLHISFHWLLQTRPEIVFITKFVRVRFIRLLSVCLRRFT